MKIRWAPRLPPRWLERLYASDARGVRDDELCDEVGFRLLGTRLRRALGALDCGHLEAGSLCRDRWL